MKLIDDKRYLLILRLLLIFTTSKVFAIDLKVPAKLEDGCPANLGALVADAKDKDSEDLFKRVEFATRIAQLVTENKFTIVEGIPQHLATNPSGLSLLGWANSGDLSVKLKKGSLILHLQLGKSDVVLAANGEPIIISDSVLRFFGVSQLDQDLRVKNIHDSASTFLISDFFLSGFKAGRTPADLGKAQGTIVVLENKNIKIGIRDQDFQWEAGTGFIEFKRDLVDIYADSNSGRGQGLAKKIENDKKLSAEEKKRFVDIILALDSLINTNESAFEGSPTLEFSLGGRRFGMKRRSYLKFWKPSGIQTDAMVELVDLTTGKKLEFSGALPKIIERDGLMDSYSDIYSGLDDKDVAKSIALSELKEFFGIGGPQKFSASDLRGDNIITSKGLMSFSVESNGEELVTRDSTGKEVSQINIETQGVGLFLDTLPPDQEIPGLPEGITKENLRKMKFSEAMALFGMDIGTPVIKKILIAREKTYGLEVLVINLDNDGMAQVIFDPGKGRFWSFSDIQNLGANKNEFLVEDGVKISFSQFGSEPYHTTFSGGWVEEWFQKNVKFNANIGGQGIAGTESKLTRAEALTRLGFDAKDKPSRDEIRKTYRRLSMRAHPDSVSDPAEKAKKEEEFKRLSEAHTFLAPKN